MGQIIIEIPQKEVHIYRFQDIDRVKKLLADLDAIARIEKDEEDEDILGLWTVREPLRQAAKQ
ncbi:MAG TPA: hypothetical protein VIL74_25835 [Pyrinomonadaceae bacterium]|jgi:hypothetical protein